VWTPQFRDIDALCHVTELVGERAVPLFPRYGAWPGEQVAVLPGLVEGRPA
jgi:hypothetical protein